MTKKLSKEEKEKFRLAGENSLLRAGVGKMYFDLKLATFGKPGETILARMEKITDFKKWVRTGHGFSLECKTHKTFGIAPSLTRAMRLSGIDVRLVGVIDLKQYLDEPDADYGYTPMDDFENAKALVIRRFVEPTFAPYDAPTIQQIEYYLLKRIENGLSVSVQYQGDLRGRTHWTPHFLGMLADLNEKVMLA